MSNVVKIKRAGIAGTATPPALAEGELAYSENSKNLFIGTNGGADVQVIGGNTSITKLAGIEAGADITDPVNVNAAGAVMEGDTTTAAMAFVIDEDSMASNLSTKVPTQQSVKAYVDGAVSSGVVYKGGYDAATNTPLLDSTPITTEVGDMYTVTVAGLFFTETVEPGDVLISEAVNATTLAQWTIVQTNLDAPSVKTMYESNADTNAFTNAMKTKVDFVSVTQVVNLDTMESDISTNNAKVSNVSTNLGKTATVSDVTIESSDGTNVAIGAASTALAGVMTKAMYDAHVLNNAKVSNVNTNLSVGTVTATNVPILSSDGSDITTLPAATASLAGVMINGAQAFGGTKTFGGVTGASGAAIMDSFVIDGGSF